MKRVDISGQRFGRLLVLHQEDAYGKHPKWRCVCDCGEIAFATYTILNNGDKRSCGCLRRETSAKTAKGRIKPMRGTRSKRTPEYRSWISMKNRCSNENNQDYSRYGGRGIKVCDRWLESFENFLEDMGERPSEKHSIDRIDVNGDYEPENCRWATDGEQANNKRNNRYVEHLGLKMTVSQWAKKLGMSKQVLLERLNANWPIDEALLTPVTPGNKRSKISTKEVSN